MSYGKGWWDYVEILRCLSDKFEIAELEVVGTYVMKTPPPQEELLMPVVKLKMDSVELIVKYDFGVFPAKWTISVKGSRSTIGSTFGLFENVDLRQRTITGFASDWVYPPYSESPSRFSCELDDEWDVAAFIWLVLAPDSRSPYQIT